ncbi:MAG: hypothetical protein HYZ16_08595 [Bacteroidetes bacterium]|jgi:hypothetical protein|nr:hypothetical protein [Bacteroidota bacterium]
MKLFLSLLCVSIIASCGQTDKGVGDTGAQCSTDTAKRELGVGESSELAAFMRHMDKSMAGVKKAMKLGQKPTAKLDFTSILTASPTKEGITEEPDYVSYAQVFLRHVEALNHTPADSFAHQHNLVINSCIACHNSFCTGPIARIKKHLVNPDNIRVAH